MGRPAGHDTRDVVNAISDVAATGCQWRAPDVRPAVEHRAPLPPAVVSGRHLDADLRSPPPRSEADGRDAEASAGGIDARSVREHRRSPRREGRRGREDGLGTHDLRRRRHPRAHRRGRRGGRLDERRRRRHRGRRSSETDVDAPIEDLLRYRFHESLRVSLRGTSHLGGVARKIHSRTVEVLRGRSVGERTWSSLRNNRRLQVDCERRPFVAEGVVWAAHARLSSVA
jgi:hypothetical protein